MPRISSEARSASVWRAGQQHPQAPKHLGKDAKLVWREIVENRPADFFAPGSLHLLEQFCVATVAARRVAEMVETDPIEAADVYAKYMGRCAVHATKLRLSIQSALRTESGKNEEKEASAGKPDLLGGRHLRVA